MLTNKASTCQENITSSTSGYNMNGGCYIVKLNCDKGQCKLGEPPFKLTEIKPLREYKVDICDFGVIKYEFEFSEFFDRPVPSLCVTIFSSDENARAQPEIIRNAKPGEIQHFNLLASWTDTNEVFFNRVERT